EGAQGRAGAEEEAVGAGGSHCRVDGAGGLEGGGLQAELRSGAHGGEGLTERASVARIEHDWEVQGGGPAGKGGRGARLTGGEEGEHAGQLREERIQRREIDRVAVEVGKEAE